MTHHENRNTLVSTPKNIAVHSPPSIKELLALDAVALGENDGRDKDQPVLRVRSVKIPVSKHKATSVYRCTCVKNPRSP